MSIPISSIVAVNPRLISAGQTGLELNGMFLTSNEKVPTDTRVVEFTDPESVADYFGSTSAEYNVAAVYFAGYENSFRKPARIYFARYITADVVPYLRGGSVSKTVAELKKITGASLKFTIGATEGSIAIESITVDFSTIGSYSDAAALIQAAIRAKTSAGIGWTDATVIYESDFEAFLITGGVAGKGIQIGFADGSNAEDLSLTAKTGAVLSQGASAQTVAETMLSVTQVTDNFVSFTTIDAPADEDMFKFQAWATAKGVRYLYVVWSQDGSTKTSGKAEENVWVRLTELNPNAVTAVYGDVCYAAFVMGMAASIDYNRTNGTITTAFKRQSGLTVNVSDSGTANALRANGFNYYGNYAENNTQFSFFYPGMMYGQYKWIDAYVNAVWLNANIQQTEMTLLSNIGRLPYTEAGYTMVIAAAQNIFNVALTSGVIDAGVSLSPAQKAQVNREAGKDIASTIETDGYYMQVIDPSATVRGARETPEISLWYTYGGAIQRMVIASTVIE